MMNTATAVQLPTHEATGLGEGFRQIATPSRPVYTVVLAVPTRLAVEAHVREVIARCRGQVEWLMGNRSHAANRLHLRLNAARIDDVVTALEAAGFDVLRVVLTLR